MSDTQKNPTAEDLEMLKIDTDKLATYEGILWANLWGKVEGKERIYLETEKANGGKNWNGGKGYSCCYIDLNTSTLVASGEAGAKTRNMLEETFEAIAAEFDLRLNIKK